MAFIFILGTLYENRIIRNLICVLVIINGKYHLIYDDVNQRESKLNLQFITTSCVDRITDKIRIIGRDNISNVTSLYLYELYEILLKTVLNVYQTVNNTKT